MCSSSTLFRPLAAPRTTLLTLFVLWKAVLLVIAVCSPGPGYDTSTTLAFEGAGINDNALVSLLAYLCTKLTRWDAIYFTKVARRGYFFEQEWAFGWGFTTWIHYFASDLRAVGFQDFDFLESFVAITLAHAAHGLSVLALYHLGLAVFPDPQRRKIAFVAACLHIISPAGIFLSAPYGESTFACLSFCGYLLFVWSFGRDGQATAVQDGLVAVAGLFFAAATTIRSNGLLNGLIFLEEVFRIVYSSRHGIKISAIRRLFTTGIGGILIAIGSLGPQYIAFREFCGSSLASEGHLLRPWCKSRLPSIYAFVQSYYWKVGFLRYWELSNIPFFVLAAPMLTILLMSSVWAMGFLDRNHTAMSLRGRTCDEPHRTRRFLCSLAVPQFVLAISALTTYHVQIITRISSGYCVWYFWLAVLLSQTDGKVSMGRLNMAGKSNGGSGKAGAVVIYMVMYAAVQAGLFSLFLPPA